MNISEGADRGKAFAIARQAAEDSTGEGNSCCVNLAGQ
jgi:hypothetical protein